MDQQLKLARELEWDAKQWAVAELITDVAGGTLDWRAIQIQLYERLINQKVDPELKAKLLSAPKDWPQEKRRLTAQKERRWTEEAFLQRKKKEAQHDRSR